MRYFVVVLLFCFSYLSLFSSIVSEGDKKNISLFNVDTLEIITVTGDIVLKSADIDNVNVELKSYSGGPELYINKGSKLSIEVKKPFFSFFNFRFSRVELIVTIPRKFDRDILVKSSSGDFNFNSIDADNLNIKLSSGDITGEDIQLKKGSFNTSSGDIEIKRITSEISEFRLSSGSLSLSEFEGEINGRLSSGNVSLEIERLNNDIDLSLSSGNADIRFNEKSIDASFDLKTSSGNVILKYPVLAETLEKRSIVGTTGSGKYRVKVRNSSGNISIW